MADDAINELISSVAHRGTAIGVSTPPEQIRHIYSRDRWYRRGVRHRSLLGRRVSVVIVAALILAVFFAPLPHVSLFSHIVAPETRPTTTAPTATTLPAAEVTPAAIWVVGATTVWAWWTSGEAQGIERSNDAGHSWSNATPPELDKQLGDHFIKGFYALGAEHAWVTYGGVGSSARQTIASSSDGGRQWTVLGRSPSAYGCELQFATPADGWCTVIGAAAGSESVQIYRTEDGGRHWRSVYNNGPGGKTALGGLPFGCDKNVQFVNTTVGWAIFLCNGGLAPLYETTDGGTTWVRRGVAAPSFPFIDGGFADVPDLFGRTGAVGYTFHVGSSVRRSVVYVSANAGASWHAVAPPGAPAGWTVDTISPRIWRLVSGDHVLATDDGGQTWRSITSNVSLNPLYDYVLGTHVIDFVTEKTGWIVSTSSTGTRTLWRTTDGGSTWSNVAVPGA